MYGTQVCGASASSRYSLLCMVHRCVLQQAPDELINLFTKNRALYTTTRGADKLHLPRFLTVENTIAAENSRSSPTTRCYSISGVVDPLPTAAEIYGSDDALPHNFGLKVQRPKPLQPLRFLRHCIYLCCFNIVHEGEYQYCNYCFNNDQTVLIS